MSWLLSILQVLGLGGIEQTLIDDAVTFASNKVSELVAQEPTWLQEPTTVIGNVIIAFGKSAVEGFLGLPPEHLAAIATHATMNHPAVMAANPATINAGKMISPAKPATA